MVAVWMGAIEAKQPTCEELERGGAHDAHHREPTIHLLRVHHLQAVHNNKQ